MGRLALEPLDCRPDLEGLGRSSGDEPLGSPRGASLAREVLGCSRAREALVRRVGLEELDFSLTLGELGGTLAWVAAARPKS